MTIDISSLQELFGDEQLVKKYLYNFRIEAPVYLKKIQQFISEGNYQDASIEAHSLKTHLAYLKENESSDLAFQLEKLTENINSGDQIKLVQLLSELDTYMKDILESIDNLI